MKKLKTLKDIMEWIRLSSAPTCSGAKNAEERILNDLNNAVKDWIEELENDVLPPILNGVGFCECPQIIKWIKHFFNLEEDKQ